MKQLSRELLESTIADWEKARDEIPFGLGEEGENILSALNFALSMLDNHSGDIAEKVGWIQCSDRMPKDDCKVLLRVKSLVVDFVCLADFSHDTWWDEHDQAIPIEHATHWQPLPAAPKDGV